MNTDLLLLTIEFGQFYCFTIILMTLFIRLVTFIMTYIALLYTIFVNQSTMTKMELYMSLFHIRRLLIKCIKRFF